MSDKPTLAENRTSKEFDPLKYTDMFEDEMRSGAKGLLYEYAKAQKAKWESEGLDSEAAASEKLVNSYAKLKVDYLKRTASEPAMQFLKDNPKVLTSGAELMKTDFSDPRRKEYIRYDSGFEICLDNLYETDSFYDYMNDELKHWGIKGMKWGVRRYQNKDGSLTPLGKKRISDNSDMYFYNRRRDVRKIDSSTINRKNVQNNERLKQAAEDYRKIAQSENNRLLKERLTLQKAGYKFVKNPDSDLQEHNNDILIAVMDKSPVMKAAQKAFTEVEVDVFADALLADLNLRSTEKAKTFVTESLIANNRIIQTQLGIEKKRD